MKLGSLKPLKVCAQIILAGFTLSFVKVVTKDQMWNIEEIVFLLVLLGLSYLTVLWNPK